MISLYALLKSTLNCEEEKVAKFIEQSHLDSTSISATLSETPVPKNYLINFQNLKGVSENAERMPQICISCHAYWQLKYKYLQATSKKPDKNCK